MHVIIERYIDIQFTYMYAVHMLLRCLCMCVRVCRCLYTHTVCFTAWKLTLTPREKTFQGANAWGLGNFGSQFH